jgi:heptosyltransferase-2
MANGGVVIVAPNWLGDAVMALPAVADFRRHFRAERLTVAARRSIAPLFSLVDDVDEVLELPGRGGIESITSWKADAAALAAGGFETAVLLPNSFAAALTASRARIAERWGYGTDWRGRLLTRAVAKAGRLQHQAAYYQTLVAGLGIATGPLYARVHVDSDRNNRVAGGAARELLERAGVAADRPFIVFAPGAAYGRAKQWLPPHFSELAGLLVRDRGWPIVLVGTAADGSMCDDIARGARASGADTTRITSLAGQTDLTTLAGVLALARAVVSNDSGVMHLAGAIGVKVVAIFGATNEDRTSPLVPGPDSPPPTIVTHPVFCRPCMLRECPIDHRCMRGISARRVYDLLTYPAEPASPKLGESLDERRRANGA